MLKFFSKSDAQIQKDVMIELDWDAGIDATHVAVTVSDGIVTLTGSVPHFSAKYAAQAIAQRIGGVRAIADELEIDLLGSHMRTDTEIAAAALNALHWTYGVPPDLKVVVDNGWITLSGQTNWSFEREVAAKTLGSLMGVRGVVNKIQLKSKIVPADVQFRIEDALKRSAAAEGQKIDVQISGNKVTLSGNVHSKFEASDAELAAWNAPGVSSVQNDLTVGPDQSDARFGADRYTERI